MQTIKTFYERLRRITRADARYKLAAYEFVMGALNYTLAGLEKPRHVSGRELLQGIRAYGLEQYGPMARSVLAHWGVTTTLDIGHIVFNLVTHKLLGKTEEDSLEDFRSGYDFSEAFDQGTTYTLAEHPPTKV